MELREKVAAARAEPPLNSLVVLGGFCRCECSCYSHPWADRRTLE